MEKYIFFRSIIAGLVTLLFSTMPIWLGPAYALTSQSAAIREPSIDPTLYDANSIGFATNQQIAVSGRNVYVVWSETVNTINPTANSTSKSFDIFFRRSTDGGNTFGDIVNVSNNSGSSSSQQMVALPSVAAKGVGVVNNSSSINNSSINNRSNEVYVIWTDNSDSDNIIGNQQILLRRSTDGGNTFGDIMNVSNSNGGNNNYTNSLDPRLAVMVPTTMGNDLIIDENENNRTSNGNHNHHLYIFWTGCNPISDEPECNVFFRRSTDGGNTFGDIVNVSNNSSGDSNLAQISASGDNVYQSKEES